MTVEEIVARALASTEPLMTDGEAKSFARAALRALESSGWVCVPREPTEAMMDAADEVMRGRSVMGAERLNVLTDGWRAMLDAAGRQVPGDAANKGESECVP